MAEQGMDEVVQERPESQLAALQLLIRALTSVPDTCEDKTTVPMRRVGRPASRGWRFECTHVPQHCYSPSGELIHCDTGEPV